MAEHPDDESSFFQRTVILRDWWLVKCSKELEGKRFGVAGTEIAETRAMRVFTSSPIIKAFDVFTLQASDGVCIILRGFLNKERVLQSGFITEISREFIFGFPPCWEQICNNCFRGVPVATASRPILSPCKNTRRNLVDCSAESRDKTENNTAEIDDGRSGGSRAIDKKSASKKSLRLQSKSGGKFSEDEKKPEMSKVQNTTNVGHHGRESLNKAKGRDGDVEKDECEAIGNEGNEKNLDESKFHNGGDHGGEGSDKAKDSDVEKDKCEVIHNEVTSPADGCGKKHIGADDVDKVTSMSATGESLTSEQGKGELEVTRASPHSLFKDLDKCSSPGEKRMSKKSGKTLRRDGNVVEHVNHSGNKVKSAKNRRELDVSEVQNPTTNDGDHGGEGLNKAKGKDVEKDECMAINNEVISPVDGCYKRRSRTGSKKLTKKNTTKESLTSEQRKGSLKVTKTTLHSKSKDVSNSSKPGKKGTSKKSEKTLKGDCDVVERINHSVSKVKEAKENLSGGKTNRKIDFDEEVTPDKDAKKQKSNAVSADSSGQKRSRSGRVLVSSLEYWRNQIPVYDMDRNLIQVNEGHETKLHSFKRKRSGFSKAKKMKIKHTASK